MNSEKECEKRNTVVGISNLHIILTVPALSSDEDIQPLGWMWLCGWLPYEKATYPHEFPSPVTSF